MTDHLSPDSLIAEAGLVAEGAYAPYSEYRVGAVVVTADGSRFRGVNVENAAYGSTMCAEATAIGTAVSAGARELDTLAVATLDGTSSIPCGNCLQLMREFEVERVVLQEADGGPRSYGLEELLPLSFGPETLAGSE